MLAPLLSLVSAAAWGTADFLGGLSTKRLSVLTVGAVSQAAGLIVMALVVAAIGEPPPGGRAIGLGLAAGVCGAVGLAALYRALSVGTMGIIAPTAALSGVVPVAFGLATGDRPSAVQLVGIGCALVGVMATARARDPAGRGRGRVAAGVGLALVAALTLGGLVLLLDRAARVDAAWASLFLRVGALALTGAAVFVVRPSFTLRRGELPRLVGLGVLDNAANLTFALAAAAGGLLSLNAVLASLYPVATVVLARAVLHERMSVVQRVGVALALIGIGLIAAG
jgi:drug/metabolite transporter (DMT)-like permease